MSLLSVIYFDLLYFADIDSQPLRYGAISVTVSLHQCHQPNRLHGLPPYIVSNVSSLSCVDILLLNVNPCSECTCGGGDITSSGSEFLRPKKISCASGFRPSLKKPVSLKFLSDFHKCFCSFYFFSKF